jgi:hypothetical protein
MMMHGLANPKKKSTLSALSILNYTASHPGLLSPESSVVLINPYPANVENRVS